MEAGKRTCLWKRNAELMEAVALSLRSDERGGEDGALVTAMHAKSRTVRQRNQGGYWVL